MRYAMNSTARYSKIMAVWTNVPEWKRWDYHLKYSRINGSFRAGTTGVLKSKRGPESKFIIKEASKTRVVISVEFPLARLRIIRIVIPLKRGCTFMHETSFEGPLGLIYGLVFGNRFKKELPIVMGKVRHIAESRAGWRYP